MIAGVNVMAADTEAEAQVNHEATRRRRVRSLFGRGDQPLTDDDVEAILRSPQAAAIDQMLVYNALGTPDVVVAYLEDFQRHTGADELMTVHHAATVAGRLRSVELLAEAARLGPGSGSPTEPREGAAL